MLPARTAKKHDYEIGADTQGARGQVDWQTAGSGYISAQAMLPKPPGSVIA
jgi:hypothetical protein